MAFLDENNDVLAGKGKDPLKELDDELEQLMAQLGDMSGGEDAPAEDPGSEGEPYEDNNAAQPVNSVEAEEHYDVTQREIETMRNTNHSPKRRKKVGKIAVVILICVLIAGLAAGGWWLYHRVMDTKISSGDTKGTVSTETFTDSELGEVTVKKVDGAALNTYDINNLVKNDEGFYEYYVDGEVVSTVGVDLAEYQGDVDFDAVKESGVDFVILRIGGRYYSDEGKLYEDGKFDTYYQQATDAGLKVGAYFFSQAASVEDAVEEAEYVVEKLDGRDLDYPVAFDWEIIEDDDARTDNMSGHTITKMAEAFCDTIEDEGYDSIVYSSTSLMLQSYDFETMKDYEFWLADYREFPNMYYDFAIWQYATDGEVAGIDGSADLNICFKPY